MSALFCSTCAVPLAWFGTTFSTILSRWGVGRSGRIFELFFAHCGFRVSTHSWPGVDELIVYGPVEGAGFGVWSLSGVSGGTRAVNGIASSKGSDPFGSVRLIVIFPVLSFVLMPEIVFAFPLWKSVAPTIVLKKGAPPESTLNRRCTVLWKSEAFTGVPSENLRPLRRVMV